MLVVYPCLNHQTSQEWFLVHSRTEQKVQRRPCLLHREGRLSGLMRPRLHAASTAPRNPRFRSLPVVRDVPRSGACAALRTHRPGRAVLVP